MATKPDRSAITLVATASRTDLRGLSGRKHPPSSSVYLTLGSPSAAAVGTMTAFGSGSKASANSPGQASSASHTTTSGLPSSWAMA
eukprot:3457761-Prymnesium_polylepis.2